MVTVQKRARGAGGKRTGARATKRRAAGAGVRTLAIDVGGTGLKAAVLGEDGAMATERVRVETPHPCEPKLLVSTLVKLVRPLAPFSRVSVGFPGVVRKGRVLTAPNLGTERFAGFDLAGALQAKLGAPVRVANDADMQGLAVVKGRGVEMVITLGTGFGTALFVDGRLGPHLEIAHLPFKKGETYDQHLGDRAREAVGSKKWSRRVEEAIENLRVLTCFDRLYIGGGNAKKLKIDLPAGCEVVDNQAGILGGIRLWDDRRAPG